MAALILLIAPSVSLAGEPFEGKWLPTVSCESARDALGSLMGSRPNMSPIREKVSHDCWL
jgi:hypothetical protein